MRATSLLRTILNLKHTKVVGFEFSDCGLVVDVAPTTRLPRCAGCGPRCRRCYDARSRQWRHQDFAGMEVVVRYTIRRVECDRCGVSTELVPWAEPGAWLTRDFEDTVALFAAEELVARCAHAWPPTKPCGGTRFWPRPPS